VVKKRTAAPDPLAIELHLGPESILGAPGSRAAPVEPVKPQGGPYPPVDASSSDSATGKP
ncbi:MAG TPA: type VI secretion system lipoprotein TssJ, partial [Burkholderiaceae bacterium]|nr:type VI secretion system lipoprotein TssJ [Burkholderiaceae bacterium]